MKLFVWDLHGTLEKGAEEGALEIQNRVLADFGYKKRFTKEEQSSIWGKRWFEFFEYLLPDETHERYLELQSACFEKQLTDPEILETHLRPTNFAHQVLSKIQNCEHDQILLSNATPRGLDLFVNILKLDNYFPKDKILSANTHELIDGPAKLHILNNYIENKHFEGIITTGDSPDDVALTEITGCTSYLYAHPHKEFRDCEADYKIRDLRLVLNEL